MKGKRVTSQMVAERAGVSQTAVSFVLNGDPQGKIGPEAKKRIQAAMKELNYRPDLLARSMRTGKTETIGIITTGIAGGWFTRIVLGAEQALGEDGYHILLGSISHSGKTHSMQKNIELLLSRQVDGLIIITGSETQDNEGLAPLEGAGVPVVLVNYYSDTPLPYGRVYVGYKKAAIEAVTHLAKLGSKHIAYVGRSMKADSTGFTREIYEGYQAGLEKVGLSFSPELVHFSDQETDHFQMGLEITEQILSSKPDAIYCLNDHIAFGILRGLRERGVEIPSEIKVVGNDDFEAAKFVEPALSSVDMMLEDCGVMAGRLLLSMLDGEEPTAPLYGPAKVKVRASTRIGGVD